MQVIYNPASSRAKKARFGSHFTKKSSRILLWLITLGLMFAGTAVLVSGNSLGALFFILPIFIMMALFWWYGELKDLPPTATENMQSLVVHEVLEKDVLAKLKVKNPSPLDIWEAINGSWHQQFFSIRYGLSPDIFAHSLSNDPQDSTKLWLRANELSAREHQLGITAGSLVVALFESLPEHEDHLNNLGLDQEDILAGIDWQHHISLVHKRFSKKENFGGIGRDWSAGYTPYLNQLGNNMSADIQMRGGLLHRDSDTHKQVVSQMIKVLADPGKTNIALVGNVGVGKTTTVYSFAQALLVGSDVPQNLRYKQVVSLDASSLISQVGDRGTLEDLMLRLMNEAVRAKNIILFFDEAQLFFNQDTGSIDLSNILMPVLEGGALSAIFAMPPKQWERLKAHNPTLAGLMNYQIVGPPNEEDTMQVLEDQVLFIEYRQRVYFTYQSLKEAYRLADHYVQDIDFPGKAIKLLDAATAHAVNGLVTLRSVQQSVEATMGVKVQTAGTDEKQHLLELENHIHRRMINQTRAVSVVSNALRRARSGVGNPNRPIGTFLFLGPTGVGKTELAKALSGEFFNGDEQIIRVDMNEFVSSEDVKKLINPSSETSTSFLGQIRKQPFSVVLFDEIEKAHPDVVNVLLQLLDEGEIKDTDNRGASFRDAIIIATSNAGANEIRTHIDSGEKLEDFEDDFINKLIENGQFKPEFINRFDEIVLFRPLNRSELKQIVDLLLIQVNDTLNRQKVSVSLSEEAKDWLVEKGYDPRLGARPMRRMKKNC